MNNFFEEFKKQIVNKGEKPIGSVVLDFFARYSHFDNYIFLEGYTDTNFYSELLKDKIKNKNTSFIKCNGKENVIFVSNYLESINGKEKHYIVDKDYTGLSKIKAIYPEKISMTKYYSFENYFFEDKNLDKLLDECNFTLDEKKLIKDKFNEYIQEILDYEVIVCMNANNKIEAKLNKKIRECIKLNEENKIVITPELKERINEIKNTLNNKKKKIYFKEKKDYLINQPLEIRGHDFELFFDKIMEIYLKNERFEDFKFNREVISKLSIDFELK